jgi:hypothetical protein
MDTTAYPSYSWGNPGGFSSSTVYQSTPSSYSAYTATPYLSSSSYSYAPSLPPATTYTTPCPIDYPPPGPLVPYEEPYVDPYYYRSGPPMPPSLGVYPEDRYGGYPLEGSWRRRRPDYDYYDDRYYDDYYRPARYSDQEFSSRSPPRRQPVEDVDSYGKPIGRRGPESRSRTRKELESEKKKEAERKVRDEGDSFALPQRAKMTSRGFLLPDDQGIAPSTYSNPLAASVSRNGVISFVPTEGGTNSIISWDAPRMKSIFKAAASGEYEKVRDAIEAGFPINTLYYWKTAGITLIGKVKDTNVTSPYFGKTLLDCASTKQIYDYLKAVGGRHSREFVGEISSY